MLQDLRFQTFQDGSRGGGAMKQNFEVVKGYTFTIGIEIEFDENPQQLDNAFFTCKSVSDDKILFQKYLNGGISFIKQDENKLYYRVRVDPSDTKKLEVGRYYYDVEVRLNSDVYTILRGILKIEKEITE